MEKLRLSEAVRTRPGMWVGDVDDDAPLNVLLELLANAFDQHLAGRCARISVAIAADGSVTVEDDGPGLEVHGSELLPPLDDLLSEVSVRPTVDGHRPHVHLGIGGAGLAVACILSERFEVIAVRDGVESRAIYARGAVVEPLASAPTRRASGTTVRYTLDREVFRLTTRVSRAELARQLEDLAFLSPKLTLQWSIAGDDRASDGLAARVAFAARCPVAEVARMQASYETAKGPIDVEVAIAWRSRDHERREPAILDSFVNLKRTRGHGSHVEGVLDGVHQFLGGKRSAHPKGFIAAVAVVLADVKYGNPTHDRLASPEVRAPVAEATRTALERWAERFPDAAAALRASPPPR